MARAMFLEGISFHVWMIPEEWGIRPGMNDELKKIVLEMQSVLNDFGIHYTVSKFRYKVRIYIPKKNTSKVSKELFTKLLMLEKKTLDIHKKYEIVSQKKPVL